MLSAKLPFGVYLRARSVYFQRNKRRNKLVAKNSGIVSPYSGAAEEIVTLHDLQEVS